MSEVKRDIAADRLASRRVSLHAKYLVGLILDAPICLMNALLPKALRRVAEAFPHYLTRTETAESRVAALEGALEAAIDTLTALRWCPPGSHCTTVSGSRIGMRPECRVCIRDYLIAKGKEAAKQHA